MTTTRSSKRPTAMTIAWLLLVVTTDIGWWFGHIDHGQPEGRRLAMAGVVIPAFAKAGIVGFKFMELRHAPRWLRHGYDPALFRRTPS